MGTSPINAAPANRGLKTTSDTFQTTTNGAVTSRPAIANGTPATMTMGPPKKMRIPLSG
jgi:hypothetical protein